MRTEQRPGEVLGDRLKRGRCNGGEESEVRQMEVADGSTLHCTHGDDEGRESGGEEVEVMKSKTQHDRLHDT